MSTLARDTADDHERFEPIHVTYNYNDQHRQNRRFPEIQRIDLICNRSRQNRVYSFQEV